MANFNVDEALYLWSLHISPVPAWDRSEEEVRVCSQSFGSSHQRSSCIPIWSITESVERSERFIHSMTKVDNSLAAAEYFRSLPATMGQTYDSSRYKEEDFFLHARPAHVSASSSTARQSLPDRSPTPDFLTGTHSEFNSGRFEAPLFGFSPSPPGMRAASTTAANSEPDIFAFDNTNPSRETSPPQYSQIDIAPNYNQRSLLQPLISSGRSTPRDFPSQRRTRQGMQAFIDLTADPTSPTMPAAISTLTSPRTHGFDEAAVASLHASKRRKVQSPASPIATSFTVRNEPEKIEEVDLRDVDDDTTLSKVLEQQRAETVKSQQNDGNQPIKLSNLQCIICMEPMTNITATHCGRSATCTSFSQLFTLSPIGHLFCHTCLMEALIAGEQQTEPGKAPLSRCPVCRKKVRRHVPGSGAKEAIPLELKFVTKRSLAKDKATQ